MTSLRSVHLASVNALLDVDVIVSNVFPLESENLARSKTTNGSKHGNQAFSDIEDREEQSDIFPTHSRLRWTVCLPWGEEQFRRISLQMTFRHSEVEDLLEIPSEVIYHAVRQPHIGLLIEKVLQCVASEAV